MESSLESSNQFAPYIPNVNFELIPIKDLVSNQGYQRALSLRHVRKAAEDFDVNQINPVKVSRRNGINFVFDGQHTIEIISEVSKSRETPVWCMVYNDLEYNTEAEVFANQQKHNKPLLPYEIFKAHIEAGDSKELMIRDLVGKYGLRITASAQPGGICAISTLENLYDKYGVAQLDVIIRYTVKTWEGEPQSFASGILKGIARLLDLYAGEVDERTFINHLSLVSPKELIRTAKSRGNGQQGYLETLVVIQQTDNTASGKYAAE